MEATIFSEISVPTRATQRYIPEDILQESLEPAAASTTMSVTSWASR
jgi:hypothetical protein